LGRARPRSRPQYLRIKGLALNATGEIAAARDLWQRVLDEPTASWVDRATTTEHLADSYRASEPARAADLYRRVIELSPTGSGTSGTQRIKLAELLLTMGALGDLEEAGRHLEWWVENAHSPFPSDHFAWNVACVGWAQALGDKEAAQSAARRALELTSRGPVFSRHPTVGIVHADDATLKWLRSVATSRWTGWRRRRPTKRPLS